MSVRGGGKSWSGAGAYHVAYEKRSQPPCRAMAKGRSPRCPVPPLLLLRAAAPMQQHLQGVDERLCGFGPSGQGGIGRPGERRGDGRSRGEILGGVGCKRLTRDGLSDAPWGIAVATV